MMTREDVYGRLQKVFREVFDDEEVVVGEKTTAEDIEDWDSFEHINLMVAVEEELSFRVPMGRVSEMKNVGEMVDIILEHVEE